MRRDPTDDEEAFARALQQACDDASGEARVDTFKNLDQPMRDAIALVREVSTALLLGEPERLRDMLRKLDDLDAIGRRVWWAVNVLEQRREALDLDPWTMERAHELRDALAVHSCPTFAKLDVEQVHRIVGAWLGSRRTRTADAVVGKLAKRARAYGWPYEKHTDRSLTEHVRGTVKASRRREAEELATVARHQPNAASRRRSDTDDESAES